MPDRSTRTQRQRQIRRRRRFVVLAACCIPLIAVVMFLNSRGGVTHPKDWATNTHGVQRKHLKIHSAALGRTMPIDVLLPKDYDESKHSPILVVMHGRGATPGNLSSKAAINAEAAAGPSAPIVALPYGGVASYWHNRADGKWGTYVTRDVVNAVANKYGGDRKRVALAGISMGGYGAFNLASKHPGRYCAVAGMSPALWQTGGETAAGAFDSAEDFANNDVIATARNNPSAYSDTKLWLEAGDEDPFQPGDKAMIAALRQSGADLKTKSSPGGHTNQYWIAHYPAFIKFSARALASCKR
jgi:S-formylglutathione hydrolase FrmB